MRSPRVEGPPVLQPVGESSTPITPKEAEVGPVEEPKRENDKVPTPPMPVLVEGEDFYDNDDASSFEVLDELNAVNSTGSTKKGSITKSPSTSLSNGIISKEVTDFKPLLNDFPMNSDERVNGDHEEPVLEKFFRLFTPSTQDVIQTDIVNDYFSGKLECKADKKPTESNVVESEKMNTEVINPSVVLNTTRDSSDETSQVLNSELKKIATPTKRRRLSRKSSADVEGSPPKRLRRKKSPSKEEQVSLSETNNSVVQENKTDTAKDGMISDVTEENSLPTNRKNQRKSPQQRIRGRPAKNQKPSPAKSGRKPVKKERVVATTNALEMRYMRSPYIVSTSESDSIVSRFQVVNPALRDAAAVNILDHPFRHSVKVVPVSTLSVKPWVCVFCGHGTSFNELGCLFGPYFIDMEKVSLPADSIYPLENSVSQNVTEMPEPQSSPSSPQSLSPESIPSHPPLPPPPPPPPPPPSYSPPSSPINKTDDVLWNGGDESESDEASEVSVTSKPENELANEANSSSSCRKTRSGRRSIPKSYDDDWRPSSMSSFRNSKARNCQPIIVAKDIRKTNDDIGKKSKGVKQIDIAAMFFSSDQNVGEKMTEKISGSGQNNQPASVDKSKRVSSRRKSEPPAAQVYEELTRKFNLRLDRTDAIPKKNTMNSFSSNIKKEKVETSINKNSARDDSKVDVLKTSKENSDDETATQADKCDANSKVVTGDVANHKIANLDKNLSVKIESKISMQILKDYQSYNKQNKTGGAKRGNRNLTSPSKSRVVSAKKVAKAKLQTARQTAKNKHSKEMKSDSQLKASASECNLVETSEKAVVKTKRPRGRPPKIKNDESPASRKSSNDGTKSKLKECRSTKTAMVSEKPKVETSPDTKDKDIYKDARLSSNGEVWFHMECVLWTSGTFLNGKTVVGLEETLNVALHTICKSCNTRGAMLACVQRGCDKTYHFFCAVREGAYLDNDQFCIYCAKHKAKILLNKLSVHPQLLT